MPEFFACMDIGKMNFNCRHTTGDNCISERNTRVGVSGGIDHNHVKLSFRQLNPAHQLTFKVGLPEINFYLQFGGTFTHFGFDIRQSRVAVDFRLALTEKVQVWPIQK